jgi:hypothetical protein
MSSVVWKNFQYIVEAKIGNNESELVGRFPTSDIAWKVIELLPKSILIYDKVVEIKYSCWFAGSGTGTFKG